MEEVIARLRRLRVAPYKARLVMDQIRGKRVEDALQILSFSKKQVASPVRDLVKSVVANAEDTKGWDADILVISQAFVGQGPTMKRFRARARGRSSRILKRTSHLTVAVREQV